MFDVIALDADDTLWHNERIFVETQEKFRALLRPYHSDDWIDRRLYETEIRNLQHYGYGIKGFTLSMIETAVELTEGRITGTQIGNLLQYAREMLTAPVEILPHVEETIRALSDDFALMLLTKGDLFDQETKIARSGLGGHFRHVEIVREKDESTYAGILARHGIAPERFLMVGNSLRSDILPVLALGGHAVYIPYAITWAHETVTEEINGGDRFAQLEHIGQLPDHLRERQGRPSALDAPIAFHQG